MVMRRCPSRGDLQALLAFALSLVPAACGDNLEPPAAPVGQLETAAPGTVPAGDRIDVSCTRIQGDLTEPVEADLRVTPEEAIRRDGKQIIAQRAGDVEVA